MTTPLSTTELAARLDASFWKPAASAREFAAFCAEARERRYRALGVNSARVALAAAGLEDSPVKVVALIGFPLGATDSDVKRYEAEVAIDFGAQELELVLNLDHLKNGHLSAALRELRDVVAAADEVPVCAVLETKALTRAELAAAGAMLGDVGVAAVSTGTDFWPDARVTVDDVKALRAALDAKIALKAVGHLRDLQVARELITAGAARLGSTQPGGLFKS
jgi:deoxyribose-phosphate aldolase